MNNFKKQYIEETIPLMMKKFGYKNKMSVPRFGKVVLNVGVSSGQKDKEYLEMIKKTIAKISGQKPVETITNKAISNFKTKEGMVVGVKVTIRGERMWDFLERLVKVTLPRIRDFRGISPASFDGQGNYSLGFKECVAFPEVSQDEIEKVHGLQVCISTTAENAEEGRELMRSLGFPFKENK
ncbi:50S ribosomal protein L5 [Candidatus Falkowbacteria bacterium]|nr:50S ribosomal protein L5 [Candidatus Falkowbacteria bacterium]